MQVDALKEHVLKSLDDNKAVNVATLDVRGKTSITDYMVVATATSTRHAKALCDHVIEDLKKLGENPQGVEGQTGSDWVLLDLGDVVVHVMTGQAREYYQLEKLWSVAAVETSQQQS